MGGFWAENTGFPVLTEGRNFWPLTCCKGGMRVAMTTSVPEPVKSGQSPVGDAPAQGTFLQALHGGYREDAHGGKPKSTAWQSSQEKPAAKPIAGKDAGAAGLGSGIASETSPRSTGAWNFAGGMGGVLGGAEFFPLPGALASGTFSDGGAEGSTSLSASAGESAAGGEGGGTGQAISSAEAVSLKGNPVGDSPKTPAAKSAGDDPVNAAAGVELTVGGTWMAPSASGNPGSLLVGQAPATTQTQGGVGAPPAAPTSPDAVVPGTPADLFATAPPGAAPFPVALSPAGTGTDKAAGVSAMHTAKRADRGLQEAVTILSGQARQTARTPDPAASALSANGEQTASTSGGRKSSPVPDFGRRQTSDPDSLAATASAPPSGLTLPDTNGDAAATMANTVVVTGYAVAGAAGKVASSAPAGIGSASSPAVAASAASAPSTPAPAVVRDTPLAFANTLAGAGIPGASDNGFRSVQDAGAASANETAAYGAGERGVLPEAPGVASARLLQSLSRSEMQIHVDGQEFGRISVHAAYGRDSIAAQITLEHPELGSALASHVPAMEQKLGADHGLRTSVTVDTQSNGEAGGGAHGGTNTPPERRHARSSIPQIATSPDSLTTPSSSPYLASLTGPSTRLDIRI